MKTQLAAFALVPIMAWPGPNPIDWVRQHTGSSGRNVEVVAVRPNHRVDCNVRLFKPKSINGRSGVWQAVRPAEFDFEWCKRHYSFNPHKVGAPQGRGRVAFAKLRSEKGGKRGRYTVSGPGAGALGDGRAWHDVRIQAV